MGATRLQERRYCASAPAHIDITLNVMDTTFTSVNGLLHYTFQILVICRDDTLLELRTSVGYGTFPASIGGISLMLNIS